MRIIGLWDDVVIDVRSKHVKRWAILDDKNADWGRAEAGASGTMAA